MTAKLKNEAMTLAILVCERPRRVKMPVDAASALKFQNSMSNDKAFQQASIDFMLTNPSNLAGLARAINLLKLPSLHVTSNSLHHALVQEGCQTVHTDTVVLNESDHSLQVRRAERTLRHAMNGLHDMDFSDL